MVKMRFTAFILIIGLAQTAFAKKVEKIDFPEEELARESVLPIFDTRVSVKNRRVKYNKRFEFNLMTGMVMSEPVYDPFHFGASLTYHFSNTHGFHLMGAFFNEGLSGSGEDLRNGNVIDSGGGSGAVTFDALEAPSKEVMIAGHYQYTAYYGKISISKELVMNLSLAGLGGGGFYIIGSELAPMVNFGISQRLYFNSRMSLRFDLLFSLFNGPDITSAPNLETGGAAPDESEFDNTFQFDSNIYLGLSFLL